MPISDLPAAGSAEPTDENIQVRRRTVYFISDSTGITAETFGNSILAQFEMKPKKIRLPFVNTVDKAYQVVRQINDTAASEGQKPIVFTTLVNQEVFEVINSGCKGMLLDMFGTFVHPLENELGMTSNHRIGRYSDVSKSQEYHDRIEAINFSLAHDDGQSNRDLASADVILIGVSRSGKTPTATGADAVPQENLWPEHPARAPQRNPQRTAPEQPLCLAGKLPCRDQRGRGHDAPLGHTLAVNDDQVD